MTNKPLTPNNMRHGYKILAVVGFVVWLYGSWTGGWSAEPQSNFEGYTDFIGHILIYWGLLGDVFKDVSIEWKKIIKTDNLTLNKLKKIYKNDE